MTERTQSDLDAEGIPDLEGPLPEKAATGDGQEGTPPPSSRPASFDYGVTASEQRAGEPISVRVARERADIVNADEPTPVLVSDSNEAGDDTEKDLFADASYEEPSLSAEEAAVHITDNAPGAVDGPDSYLADDE
jgi:hypothetical protein